MSTVASGAPTLDAGADEVVGWLLGPRHRSCLDTTGRPLGEQASPRYGVTCEVLEEVRLFRDARDETAKPCNVLALRQLSGCWASLVSKLHRIKSIKNQINFNRKYLPEFVKLQKLIEEHAPQNSKVMDYARMMGKSTKTLNNITQTIINKTAKEFIDEICAVQIKRILINTDLSIKEIAFELGFEETTNFYKYFKRQTQLTPEQFRFNFR